jgi:hypothetical protein
VSSVFRWRIDVGGRECTKCGTYKPWDCYWRTRPDARRNLPVEEARTHLAQLVAYVDRRPLQESPCA